MPINVAITDDNPKLTRSLIQNLEFFDEIKVIFTATDGKDLIKKIDTISMPDVILMDIEMPGINGIQASLEVTARFGEVIKIIMLTVLDGEDKIFDAICAGASGYLMKDEKPTKIVNAIEEVMQGGVPMSSIIARKSLNLLKKQPHFDLVNDSAQTSEEFALTQRESEVLQEIAIGLSYKKIAEKLYISDKTVRKHTENIYRKLHIHTRFEAVQFAQRHKWPKL